MVYLKMSQMHPQQFNDSSGKLNVFSFLVFMLNSQKIQPSIQEPVGNGTILVTLSQDLADV